MVLQKFSTCDKSHQKQWQYCCIKDNKIFCSKCWFKQQHFRNCVSSRCGNYQKIAHLVINRVLQLKNIYYLQNMSSSHQSFQTARIKSIQLNFQITQIMKHWIQQKMPLFLYSMMNQMLHSKYSQHVGLSCNKYDAMCTQMLKTIKQPQQHRKSQYLQTIIANYQTIDHQLNGTINHSKTIPKQQWKGKRNDKIDQVLQYCRTHLGLFIVNLKAQMKQLVQSQVSKLLNGFDNTIKFKGVSFPKSTQQNTALFKKKQHYKNLSLSSQLFSKFQQNKSNTVDIYNGFNLNIAQLESNPEQLLQTTKSFIKQKLFSMYCSIQTFKSSYPYKCAYVISTCLLPDQDYQTTVLQLQKAYIKSIQTKSKFPFMNSLSIVIMGPQTIIVRFRNRPQFCYTIKIYNYKKSRESYYKKLKDILDLNSLKQKPQNQQDKHIEYVENPSLLQLAYSNFRIAYEQIFIGQNNEQKVFEGEKVAANRGMKLFNEVIEKWKTTAKIQLSFMMSKQQILQLMV